MHHRTIATRVLPATEALRVGPGREDRKGAGRRGCWCTSANRRRTGARRNGTRGRSRGLGSNGPTRLVCRCPGLRTGASTDLLCQRGSPPPPPPGQQQRARQQRFLPTRRPAVRQGGHLQFELLPQDRGAPLQGNECFLQPPAAAPCLLLPPHWRPRGIDITTTTTTTFTTTMTIMVIMCTGFVQFPPDQPDLSIWQARRGRPVRPQSQGRRPTAGAVTVVLWGGAVMVVGWW